MKPVAKIVFDTRYDSSMKLISKSRPQIFQIGADLMEFEPDTMLHPADQLREVEQQRDELQAKWDHYQQLCQDHNAHGIGDLIVQRDELLAALHAVRLKTDPKYGWPIIDAAIAKVKP